MELAKVKLEQIGKAIKHEIWFKAMRQVQEVTGQSPNYACPAYTDVNDYLFHYIRPRSRTPDKNAYR